MSAMRDRRALRAQPVHRTEHRSDPTEAYGIELALLLRSTDLSKRDAISIERKVTVKPPFESQPLVRT
jgi:hypothetical protein